MTSTLWKSLALGAGITIAIQSSSAMTVMLVGFVNSGLMELGQTVGLIMGSNIGTTLTAWILSLSGIESNYVFIRMLKPSSFSPVLALIGIVLIMLSKKAKRRNLGEIFLGFAILMYGMDLMSGAVEPLADLPQFTKILTYFENPILGVLTGTIFTGIIQSSAASVGILQALSMTGEITFGAALPIIMGQNIGTCVTSLISSVGASKNAKRVAAVHILFNVVGTVFFLIVVYGVNAIFPLAFLKETITPLGVAVVHSIFNVAATLLLLPFGKQLVKLASMIVRDNKKSDSDFDLIDERLLVTPSIAVVECCNVTKDMFRIAREQIVLAIQVLDGYTEALDETINANEDRIDIYEDRLGTYLVRLNDGLSDLDRKRIAQMLRAIGDLERISDHAVNILEAAQELYEKQTDFSDYAKADLAVISEALLQILNMTEYAFDHDDVEITENVESMEEVIDNLKDAIMARHIERLQLGLCTIELGFVISNVLTNYERISDHCSNLATGVVKANAEDMQMDYHGYLHEFKAAQQERFTKKVEEYSQIYSLPDVKLEQLTIEGYPQEERPKKDAQ
jgi:phosphate:Na+ symporter